MPERNAHTEALRAGTPLRVGSVTLLAIERVMLHSDGGAQRLWLSAAKGPYALIVRDAAGIRAVDTDAAAVPLDVLRERVPELDAAIARM